MELVSFLGLLLPASLSSNPVFLSPSNLPVIVVGALGRTRGKETMLSPLGFVPWALQFHLLLWTVPPAAPH